MFNNFGEFHGSLLQAWNEAKRDEEERNEKKRKEKKPIPKPMPELTPEMAKTYYEWYQKAGSQKEIVLGREQDLESLKKQYGVAEEGGSMLVGVTKWDIWVNDSWILGGIHAQLPFLLKTVLTFDSVYNMTETKNDDQTRVLFVTTREISGLNLFGYRKNKEDANGQLFLCDQKGAASGADFYSYFKHIKAVGMAVFS